jgi:hypothetical protein
MPFWDADLMRIAVGSNLDGQLEVFGMGRTDERLVRIAQMAPNGGWGGFSTSAERGLLDIEVTRFADGRLHAAALDGNPGVWQVQKRGGWGNPWPTWGVTLGQLAIDSDADGRLPGQRAGGGILRSSQAAPNAAFGPRSRF